ncbi:HepT-like ribonuclease domain-containing protein [Moheibacter lacus]|uniref:DUF86 domain-containing protein n=1 Tax=Moheibacter lacus TaxID=2745851 RepID=A0A838ZU35_9FLAO|nr:HepT-like ribonuclease domain-containing protein [Moheibacter lacus]MBA5630439.1 DUF86 domain-containing protein [Moheibacter lacus]
MLNEKDKTNIEEVLYAISQIEKYLISIHSIEDLIQNQMVYDAVQMNFILIGEATKRINEDFKITHSQIDWKGMISYRNFVVHEYFGVDVKILWAVISYELPHLKTELHQILNYK